jgi:hypothetical protein
LEDGARSLPGTGLNMCVSIARRPRGSSMVRGAMPALGCLGERRRGDGRGHGLLS